MEARVLRTFWGRAATGLLMAALAACLTAGAGEERVSQAEVVRKLNALSEQLFNAALARPENAERNVTLLPLGMALDLLALESAASGEAQREIQSLLTLAPGEREFAVSVLRGVAARKEFAASRAVWWLDRGVAWNEETLARLRSGFGAVCEKVDFSGDPERARMAVNAWARQSGLTAPAAGGAAGDGLVPGDGVRTATKLLLVNGAACPKLPLSVFPADKAGLAPFAAATGPVRAETLVAEAAEGQLFEGETFRAAEIAVGGGLALALYVPKLEGAEALSVCEKAWGAVRFGGWKQTLAVRVPRLDLATVAAWRPTLERVGLETVFAAPGALDALAPETPLENLYQADFLTLDARGLNQPAPVPPVPAPALKPLPAAPAGAFVADRPFIAVARDQASGLVVAMARVVTVPDRDPTPPARHAENSVARGYGPWAFGATAEVLMGTAPENGPYQRNAEGRLQTRKAPWAGKDDRRAEFEFDAAGRLNSIRLWVAENVDAEAAAKALAVAEKYLQKLTGSDYALTSRILARLAAKPESVPAIASDEIPQVMLGMRARLTAIRHPQLGWQVYLAFTAF